MSKKKQTTIFGLMAKQKTFYCYENPSNDYECFVERYCLRNKGSGIDRRNLIDEAISVWQKDYKTIKKKEDRKVKVEKFLELKRGEKPFVR